MTWCSLEYVRMFVRNLRDAREECPLCSRLPATSCPPCPGWEFKMLEYEWLKHCDVCAVSLLYPWAQYLDVERVHAFLNSQPPPEPGRLFRVDCLKALVHG